MAKKTTEQKPEPKVKKPKGEFKLEMLIDGQTLKAEGNDVIAMFKSLQPLPQITNTVRVWLEYKGVRREEALNVIRARRAFGGSEYGTIFFFNNLKQMVGAKK